MNSLKEYVVSLPSWALIITLIATLITYLLPTAIAVIRRRSDVKRIAAVNVVSGLSWAAWAATLAWSLSSTPKQDKAVGLKGSALLWPAGIAALVLLTVAIRFI